MLGANSRLSGSVSATGDGGGGGSGSVTPKMSVSQRLLHSDGSVPAAVSDGPGGRLHWIGFYALGAAHTEFSDRRHVTGSKTRPASGVTSASTTFATPINRDGYEFRLFPGGVFSPVLATARVLRSRPIGTTVAAGNATVFAGAALSLAVFGGPRRLRLRRLALRIDAESRCSGHAEAGLGSDRDRVATTTARGRGRVEETRLSCLTRA
jgi:hypothetical protein